MKKLLILIIMLSSCATETQNPAYAYGEDGGVIMESDRYDAYADEYCEKNPNLCIY